MLIEYLLHSAATLACREASAGHVLSAMTSDSHFCAMCVEEAREALQTLCRAAENGGGIITKGWALFLNM